MHPERLEDEGGSVTGLGQLWSVLLWFRSVVKKEHKLVNEYKHMRKIENMLETFFPFFERGQIKGHEPNISPPCPPTPY